MPACLCQRHRTVIVDVHTPFLQICDGYSPDRVVADPELNNHFLGVCRSLGISVTDEEANKALLNARKAGRLSGYRTARRTSFPNENEYRFASEIAIRFLERRDSVTLDDVICSPVRAAEFDSTAGRICPGFTPLQYRWAALNLRKRRRLQPEPVGKIATTESIINSRVHGLHLDSVSSQPGVYLFFDSNTTLYVGEAQNLRRRIAKHLEHSDSKGLAHWVWEHGTDHLNVELHILPTGTATRVRRALELELIRSRHPEFNIRGR